MKITRDTVKAVRRECVGLSGRYTFEYGQRAAASAQYYTGNALLWREDADLFDTDLLAPGTIIGDPERGGMVLLDLYVYHHTGYDSSLSGNIWVLFDEFGNKLAHDNDYNRIMREVEKHTPTQIAARARREEMQLAAEKWRKLAGMPRTPKSRKFAPLDIVADWAQDHDDEPAAKLLREAHAAGFKW
jgi:hypothetical protein